MTFDSDCLLQRTCSLLVLLGAVLLPASASSAESAESAELAELVESLAAALPQAAEQFEESRVRRVEQLARQLPDRAAARGYLPQGIAAAEVLRRLDATLAIKQRVDSMLNDTLALRVAFGKLPKGPPRRDWLRGHLRVCSALIELSGRLRYLLYDAVRRAENRLGPRWSDQLRLLDLLAQHRSSIGASAVIGRLFYDSEPPLYDEPVARQYCRRLLNLTAASGCAEELPALADFVLQEDLPPILVLSAVDAIGRLGLPQDPRPEDPDDALPPPITAGELQQVLSNLDSQQMTAQQREVRDQQLRWLAQRTARGMAGEYRLGPIRVRPGDWLLMRNPSPYNLFTDLSPGLFTHVGVITDEPGSDGLRRMVLVDLPERGRRMRTTNIEQFVVRTNHYAVLRHPDAEVAAAMAGAARAVIGNPTVFDLNFRTDRIEQLRGKPLENAKIHTYCAGLLLLCAQATGRDRSEFFPIVEYPAGGRTVSNLAQLGLSFGDRFVSPTGPLYSSKLELVGRRDSMYDPPREIKEAIYDHFAEQLKTRRLTQSPDLAQSLRQRIAEAGKSSPLLARALASASDVRPEMDLVSAAKAAAVVETLDEFAEENAFAYLNARDALRAGSAETLAKRYSKEEIAAIGAYRQRHASLYRQWSSRRISPRRLRIELVDYYVDRGRRQLDERFFHASDSP